MANQLEKMNQFVMTQLLLKLETKLDADVFTYYGEIVNGVERHVKDIIEALSKDPKKHDKVYVILTTPGGSLPPVQRMVDILRHFYSEVNFIVPDYAYSAGTIWCMSGDNIYMNYYSALGPIDPQVQNKDGNLVAALGYLDKINELLEKAKTANNHRISYFNINNRSLSKSNKGVIGQIVEEGIFEYYKELPAYFHASNIAEEVHGIRAVLKELIFNPNFNRPIHAFNSFDVAQSMSAF